MSEQESKLQEASKNIPVQLVKSAMFANSPPHIRKIVSELQKAENDSEKERKLAQSMGITVEELRTLIKTADDPRQVRPLDRDVKPL